MNITQHRELVAQLDSAIASVDVIVDALVEDKNAHEGKQHVLAHTAGIYLEAAQAELVKAAHAIAAVGRLGGIEDNDDAVADSIAAHDLEDWRWQES